jgi:hypothetical protein
MMMLNLNSVSEHAAGKNPGENTRNEYEMTFLDRLGEMDFAQPVAMPQAVMSAAAASTISVEEPQAAPADVTAGPAKPDFCDALREAAESSDIPVAFFARLLWQESRFRSREVSRAGAQGVAQIMPETAAEIGLDDPFDPYKALPASAKLLQKLRRDFGNLGLAAAAYNAGSGRIQKWLSRQSSLPKETRDYVRIITGSAATEWTNESKTVSLHLQLPREAPCEGVGGLSKSKEVANMPVALAPAVSDAVRKAEAEAQHVAAAKAAAREKSELAALQKERKKFAGDGRHRGLRLASVKSGASKSAESRSAESRSAESRAESHHQTKTAKGSGRVRLASAGR